MNIKSPTARAKYYEAQYKEAQSQIKELEESIKSFEQENARLEQEVEKLKKQNERLQKELDNADMENEKLQTKLRYERVEHEEDNERNAKRIAKLNERNRQTLSDGETSHRGAIQSIASIKSDSMHNFAALESFVSGGKYYDNTLFNIANFNEADNINTDTLTERCKTNKQPIFGTTDLIIRINPKNGMELANDVISYIKEILKQEIEYNEAIHELDDYSCFHDGEELVEYAYNKGMKLLTLYEEIVF